MGSQPQTLGSFLLACPLPQFRGMETEEDDMDSTLVLVRHGESEANVLHMLSGWMDVGLTERGVKELEALRRSAVHPGTDLYFSSPLKRCTDTFHILFPDKAPIISDSFKEINFRSLEGHILPTKKDIDDYFSAWIRDEVQKDEETMTEVMERGSRAILETVRECMGNGLSSATVVMHSGIMRSSIVSLFSLDRRCFLEMSVPNGLGYILAFHDGIPSSFRPICP